MSKTLFQQQDHRQTPWNKGRLVGQKRPLEPKEVWNIRARLQSEAGKRDLATIIQKKTGRPVQFELMEQTQASVEDWLAIPKIRDGRFLFPSRVHEEPHVSTRQFAQIDHGWVKSAGLDDSAYGTHSMRRTKGAQIYNQIYKKTGNLRAVQLLLGHTKLESTVRYLGIEVEDALSISEQVEL